MFTCNEIDSIIMNVELLPLPMLLLPLPMLPSVHVEDYTSLVDDASFCYKRTLAQKIMSNDVVDISSDEEVTVNGQDQPVGENEESEDNEEYNSIEGSIWHNE
ncbi:hypothetical protein ACOSQ4_005152 [Xanthoceras sorbifolium]